MRAIGRFFRLSIPPSFFFGLGDVVIWSPLPPPTKGKVAPLLNITHPGVQVKKRWIENVMKTLNGGCTSIAACLPMIIVWYGIFGAWRGGVSPMRHRTTWLQINTDNDGQNATQCRRLQASTWRMIVQAFSRQQLAGKTGSFATNYRW